MLFRKFRKLFPHGFYFKLENYRKVKMSLKLEQIKSICIRGRGLFFNYVREKWSYYRYHLKKLMLVPFLVQLEKFSALLNLWRLFSIVPIKHTVFFSTVTEDKTTFNRNHRVRHQLHNRKIMDLIPWQASTQL